MDPKKIDDASAKPEERVYDESDNTDKNDTSTYIVDKYEKKYGGISTRQSTKFPLRKLKCLLMSSLNCVKNPNVSHNIPNDIKKNIKASVIEPGMYSQVVMICCKVLL